jgi:hypothetical protein
MWTGHVDVEGLKAIGWDDDDIACFQEHGVNWMEEDDEYYKVSDDNKALYGVLTFGNIQQYKDRIVYLPKIDFSGEYNWDRRFVQCDNMRALPSLPHNKDITIATSLFKKCKSLLYIPLFDFSKATKFEGFVEENPAIRYIPPLKLIKSINLSYMFSTCRNLKHIDITTSPTLTDASYIFYNCTSLELIAGELDVSNVMDLRYFLYNDYCLHTIIPTLDLGNATNVTGFALGCQSLRDITIKNLPLSISFKDSYLISKESLLYMINNAAATEAITITLNAYAYARLATDPDIVAALNNRPLVSLASA